MVWAAQAVWAAAHRVRAGAKVLKCRGSSRNKAAAVCSKSKPS
jgi:hypothetical protein